MSDDWPTDADFEGLAMEQAVYPHEAPEETAQRLFNENAATAAQSIVRLAATSVNERVRLSAAVYVIERVLGKTPTTPTNAKAPWEKLIAATLVDVESYANRR